MHAVEARACDARHLVDRAREYGLRFDHVLVKNDVPLPMDQTEMFPAK